MLTGWAQRPPALKSSSHLRLKQMAVGFLFSSGPAHSKHLRNRRNYCPAAFSLTVGKSRSSYFNQFAKKTELLGNSQHLHQNQKAAAIQLLNKLVQS